MRLFAKCNGCLLLAALISLFIYVQGSTGETWETYNDANIVVDVALQDNYLWCATTGGILRFDKRDYSHTLFNKTDGLLLKGASRIAVDINGIVWAACGGIARYNGKIWKTIDVEDGLSSAYIYAMELNPNGGVCIARNEDLYKKPFTISLYDGINWKTLPPNDKLMKRDYPPLTIEKNGNVWVGTNSGAWRFDGISWVCFSVAEGLPDSIITDFVIDQSGTVWAAVGLEWVCSFDGKQWKSYPLQRYFRGQYLAVGQDNSIWVGSHLQKLYRVYGGENTTWSLDNTLFENHLYAMAVDTDGTIWIGGMRGIHRCRDGKWSRFFTTYGPTHAAAISCGSDGMVWVGTTNRGLFSFDGRTWESHYEDNLKSNEITLVATTIDGTAWAHGLEHRDGQWTLHDVPGGWIYRMAADLQGGVWFLSVDSMGDSLVHFDGKTWKGLPLDPVLATARINTIAVGPDGRYGAVRTAKGCFVSTENPGLSCPGWMNPDTILNRCWNLRFNLMVRYGQEVII